MSQEPPVVTLLKDLISVPSTSDSELAIGVHLESTLSRLGYTVERTAISAGSTRHNIYAYLGTQRRTRLCLSSHMDTVPPHIPLRVAAGTTIHGRGACDDKGPLAAQVVAVEELRTEGKIEKEGDVSFLFVVGEEKGGPGMLAANGMGLAWESVLFGEPTEGKLALGHKGHLVFELRAAGKACHSGYPERGSSANAQMIKLLAELDTTEWHRSALLGASTFHAGRIEGGVAYNVLAAESYALCGLRVSGDLPGTKRKLESIVSKYTDVALTYMFEYPDTMLDHDVEGFATAPVAYGTDVPRLHGEHRRYLYGPGSILVAHGADEQIDIGELIEGVAAYKKLALHCLSRKT